MKKVKSKKCYNQTKPISYLGDFNLLCTMSFWCVLIANDFFATKQQYYYYETKTPPQQ